MSKTEENVGWAKAHARENKLWSVQLPLLTCFDVSMTVHP